MKKSYIAAGAVVGLIVIGSGTAAATNGKPLVVGVANTGTKVTTLTNSAGTPLTLNAKSGYAPFATNSTKVVPRLNADMVDNLHASAFQRAGSKSADADKVDGLDSTRLALTSGRTGYVYAAGQLADLDTDGSPDAVVAEAKCPAGTILTGGGADTLTTAPTIWNSPIGPSTWLVAVLDPSLATAAGDITSYAVCYNPRGAVAGAAPLSVNGAGAETKADAMKKMAAFVARQKG